MVGKSLEVFTIRVIVEKHIIELNKMHENPEWGPPRLGHAVIYYSGTWTAGNLGGKSKL